METINLPSDGVDLSAADIFYHIVESMGCGVKLIAFPAIIINSLAVFPVFKERINRFTGFF
jgi:hypothetical protein